MDREIRENPYQHIDWKNCEFVHSISHQHGGQWTETSKHASLDKSYRMGIRHLAVSNYYPSQPVYPLPEKFQSLHPEVLGCPNAEHHSFTDISMHACAVGSYYTTGYGESAERGALKSSPVRVVFENLNIFNTEKPGKGVYRLDIDLRKKEKSGDNLKAYLTIEGACGCDRKTFEPLESEKIKGLQISEGSRSLYLRAEEEEITVCIDFDQDVFEINRLRLMQGTNRPFREAFDAALDGSRKDKNGYPVEGLLFPDGGGITINHPHRSLEEYLPVLDYDRRVLGIEVWNHRRRFGTSRSNLHFYRLWDEILSTGRRCYGFFVKDHREHGMGRNILIIPEEKNKEIRKHEALKAYRQGSFFGLLGALSVDEEGEITFPYDHSNFKFEKIELRDTQEGKAEGIEVKVGGNEEKPNIQIRFITEKGIAKIVNDKSRAFFPFPRDKSYQINCKYVRIEAFAYPDRLDNGRELKGSIIEQMNVEEISALHNVKTSDKRTLSDLYKEGTPVSVVDMIFSQPIMVRSCHQTAGS